MILDGVTLRFGDALEAHAHFLVIEEEGERGPQEGEF